MRGRLLAVGEGLYMAVLAAREEPHASPSQNR
jgi:hypothetical protein